MLGPVADSLPFFARLRLALRLLLDARFAADFGTAKALPAPAEQTPVAALQLLGLLQREGRLVDFLQQDITTFSDADVGAAARVVHDGCRTALGTHWRVTAVRTEEEGSRVTLDAVDPQSIKLTGNVQGEPPYCGVLRHRGWRVERLELPRALPGHDFRVLAPAEVEL